MISVNEAKKILNDHCTALKPVTIPLQAATGLILAENVFSKMDVPSFNQSAMDGYAVRFDEINKDLKIQCTIQAGLASDIKLSEGNAARIFTGAALPAGSDTVVMQEKVLIKDGQLIIQDEFLKKGSNVRLKGSEIKKDELALHEGTILTPAAIGFLATIGIQQISVYPSPKVTIVITGNELKLPGEILEPGQIYESNSFALKAALHQLHINDVFIFYVKDNETETKKIIEMALTNCDLLLITGGVSVGDFDFVPSALEQCGVTKLFHKIKQKPGKPLYAGFRQNQMIVGLPGNPSSVLACFYEYVSIILQIMMNRNTNILSKIFLPITHLYNKKSGLTHFLKAICTEKNVKILNAQESYRLSSFATANCLVCLEENKTEILPGELVEVHLLSF